MKFINVDTWKKLLPVFTVWLTAMYPVLFLYAHNTDQLMLMQLLYSAMISVAVSSILFIFWLFSLKNAIKASLATVVFLIIFWNYGLLYAGMMKIVNLRHWHVVPLFLFLYFHMVYFITKIRQQKTLSHLSTILFVPIFLLVVINLLIIVPSEYKKCFSVRDNYQIKYNSNEAIVSKNYPDIYLIILDEYASLNTIKEEWGYDNDGFASFLREKGFFVAEESEARYNQTTWNMTCLLNLNYLTGPVEKETFLDFIYEPDRIKSSDIYNKLKEIDYFEQIQKWNNNLFISFLKKHGYKIVVHEGLSQHYSTFHIWQADSIFSYQNINESENYSFLIDAFYVQLIKKSMISPFEIFFKMDQSYNINYSGTKHIVNRLKKDMYYSSSPKFVYTHLMCPHVPYVFDKEGNYIQPINEGNQLEGVFMPAQNTVNAAYLEQYIYITNEIKKIVNNQVQKKPPASPIIIIQSDHGPRPHEVFLKDRTKSFDVFNAVFFPDGDYRNLNDSIAPVNTLRVILNEFFGESYDMLEDN